MKQKRTLENREDNKSFEIEINENLVTYQTIKNNKGRIYKKELKTNEDAIIFFYKKEWEMLKKNFVLSQETNEIGCPKLHYFTSNGYSGCLSFENLGNEIIVYKEGSYENVNNQFDYIDLITPKGDLIQEIKLPEILPWNIEHTKHKDFVLMDLDHSIFKFHSDKKDFERIVEFKTDKPSSIISVSEKYYCYATNENLIIKDYNDNIQFERKLALEIIKGQISFCASLSKKSEIIAIHTKAGEINLFNIKDNELIKTIKCDIDFIENLQFVENDKILILKPRYNKPLIYIDIDKEKPLRYTNLEINEYMKDVDDYCLNQDESILVLLQRDNVYVYNFKKKEFLTSFKIEHMVRRAKIRFINNDLGVRTDYGCFSIYKI